jgi:hypothetical protein
MFINGTNSAIRAILRDLSPLPFYIGRNVIGPRTTITITTMHHEDWSELR